MPYSYTQLSASDIGRMKELLKVFGDAFGEPDTYGRAIPGDAYLEALLAKRHFIVLVALHDNEVVGGLAAYELEKFEQERSEIYIYDLAVAVPHRRSGVARTLIGKLGELAKERNAYVIFVQADKGDIAPVRLYESLGTREGVHHFDISS
jgi:aminoglycoside 3-N-acetyltransferase I